MNKVHVSKMSGKLKGFRAVNFNPLTSNFCQVMHTQKGAVCEECYSTRMIRTYRASCAKPFTANAALMSRFMYLDEFVCFDPNEYVRLLAHGEMDNKEQFFNFIRLAELSPSAHFTMWTKRIDIVTKYASLIPSNLRMIQSSTYLNSPEPLALGFDAVFTVYDSMDVFEANQDAWFCAGKSCAACMFCYKEPHGNISELLRR